MRPSSPRRFGVVAQVLLGGDLATDAAAAAGAGVDGMSVACSEVERLGASTARRVLDDVGLAASSVVSIGPAVPCGGAGPIDAALAMLDAAAELGAPGVLASTGPLDEYSSREADARCRAWLERLAPRAVDLDVVVMLEPMFPMMREYSYVHTLPHALELVAGLDGATVVVDTGHLWWDPRLVECFQANVADIGTVQLTNISAHALDRLRYSTRAACRRGDPAPGARGGVRCGGIPRLVRAGGLDDRTGRPRAVRARVTPVVRRDLE